MYKEFVVIHVMDPPDFQHQTSFKQRQPIFCANCGCIGHIYKNCNHPITSYGVICYRLQVDNLTNAVYPEYLMVQRKDSLCYVEFMRGKYQIENRMYIMKLFQNMTSHERELIKLCSFDDLWKRLWQVKECTNYLREYQEAKIKFDNLKKGYIMKNNQGELIYFNVDYILENTSCVFVETEWGFPKGRRNINEHDMSCALREFNEETGISLKNIRVLRDQKPLEEVFSGSNKVRYRHLYYIACFLGEAETKRIFNPQNRVQVREIRNAEWFKYHEAQKHIREQNVERKELFKRVNQLVMKNICLLNKANDKQHQAS
jgi:8-oxo-dGTP pyrophosphatase MutT (NUDIX family)